MRSRLARLSLVLSALAGCQAWRGPSESIASLAPAALDLADDDANDLVLVVDFADPDGDIGGGVARFVDCRDGRRWSVDIPTDVALERHDHGAVVTGTLRYQLADLAATSPRAHGAVECPGAPLPADTLVVCVDLVDRHGHDGEMFGAACTPPIATR